MEHGRGCLHATLGDFCLARKTAERAVRPRKRLCTPKLYSITARPPCLCMPLGGNHPLTLARPGVPLVPPTAHGPCHIAPYSCWCWCVGLGLWTGRGAPPPEEERHKPPTRRKTRSGQDSAMVSTSHNTMPYCIMWRRLLGVPAILEPYTLSHTHGGPWVKQIGAMTCQ